jgi:negative regulator of flagellin synthesis FlgM
VKIDKPGNTLPTSSPGEGVARASGKDKSGQASTPKQPASTNVSLGSTAAHLQSMESSMANTPVVNAAKVAEIKQAISEGRFQVNTSVVADRLMATVRDLIGGKA